MIRSQVQYSVQLEQWLMEGNYPKIVQTRSTVPAPLYRHFMDTLVDTVRSVSWFHSLLYIVFGFCLA